MHDGFLDQWLICGPFYSDRGWATLDEDYLYGESTVRPREGVRSFGKAWRPWDTEDGFLQFLNAPFAHTLFVTGYAHSYVHVPETVNAQILCGSDDGIKVWLNGNVVWRKDANRAAVAGEDRASIILQAGWNSLLVKVRQGMSHWQFVLQLVGENGREIGGLTSAREGAMTAKPAAHALNVRPRFTSETYEISGGVLTRTVSFEVGNPGTERIEQAEVRAADARVAVPALGPGETSVETAKLSMEAVAAAMRGEVEGWSGGQKLATQVIVSEAWRLLRDFFAPVFVRGGGEAALPDPLAAFEWQPFTADESGSYWIAEPPGLRRYLGGLVGRFPMKDADTDTARAACGSLLELALTGRAEEFSKVLQAAKLPAQEAL